MKLQNFLQPLDSGFSTPSAALKLLRMLGGALMLSLLCGLAFTVNMAFNHQVSLARRAMNAAMYEAQLYLGQREALLDHLSGSVVPLAAGRALVSEASNDGQALPPSILPLGGSGQGLLLSARELAELGDKRLGLLYAVDAGNGPAIHRLVSGVGSESPITAALAEALYRASQAAPAARIHWLAEGGERRRLFLFEALDGGHGGGWLGLEIHGEILDAILRRAGAGSYLLLDGHGQVAFAEEGGSLRAEELRALAQGDGFGFIGSAPMPQHMALLKHIGSSNWVLVYCIGIERLLLALWQPLLLAFSLAIGVGTLLRRLGRRIEERLMKPAAQRLEALKESEAFSRAVIQAAPVALCVLRRADAAVVLENPQARQWLGGGEVVRRAAPGWIARAFAEGGAPAGEELETEAGLHLYLSYTITRYKGEDVLFCAFSDISARKQIEAELARAKLLADAANEAKTLFLATMSHEIRTPLYGVLGTLELLGRTELSRQQAGYLQAIQRSSATLLQLISDVLDVSKIEAGQLDLESMEFAPVELTEEVVQSFAAAAHAKGLQLYACLSPELPERMRGAAASIRQILNNLLSNAVKFTDNGHISVRLKASVVDAECVMLTWQVNDTGTGVAAEDQHRLFDPFYQVRRSEQLVAGTGLGLSISQRLAQLMNGNLRLVSELGLGSSFSLRLPLERIAVQAEPQELAGRDIRVMAPARDLAENLCGWIARWGGRAHLATPSTLDEVDASSVLVEVLLPGTAAMQARWPGCRVVLSPEGSVEPQAQGCDWLVGLNSLGGLRRALGLAQGCVSESAVVHGQIAPLSNLGIRILVAEDNAINQLILRDQLEALGCVVELAFDGRQALQRCLSGDFDVVLTDINMPNMNGYQLATELRRRGYRRPIVGATANAMREERERCLAAGMSDCLVKPVDLDSLQNCLIDILKVDR
ncbi:response regulator [Pseudomonas aeruginosa]|nr:response regulator [Pseudomonas aeruginosa]